MHTLAVVGSSVSLLVRPPRDSREAAPYPTLLRKHLGGAHRVENLSRPSLDIGDALERFRSEVLPLDPDIVVLHLGINECSSRFLPRRLWRWSRGATDAQIANGGARRVVRAMDIALRHPVTHFAGRAWFTEAEFEGGIRKLLNLIAKETRSGVVIVGIGLVGSRVDRILAGTSARARIFDKTLAELARESGAKFLLPPGDAALRPDGIHFSAAGHRWVADSLVGML